MACVNVCPMGIDIRDGQQLECITCALCIDACDEIMARIGKPRGLIDYMALRDESAERAGAAPKPVWKHILRPRTLMYFTMWSMIGVLLLVALFLRSSVDLNVSPVRNPLFVTMSDGAIRNTYEIRLRNKQHDATSYVFAAEAEGAAAQDLTLSIEGASGDTVEVPADETLSARLYLTAPAGSALTRSQSTPLRLVVQEQGGDGRTSVETVFHGRSQ